MFSFEDYRTLAGATAIYPEHDRGTERAINYAIVGAGDEVGEILGKWKKHLRGDRSFDETRTLILKEVGDVLWYLNRIATELGSQLADCAMDNVSKLQDRKERGVIKGDGDNR